MPQMNLDLHLTFCIMKKMHFQMFPGYTQIAYCLFNDAVEENVSPVDHKANNHCYDVHIIEGLFYTFINPFKCHDLSELNWLN